MVKIYSLSVLYKGEGVTLLNSAYELGSFGYFQRTSIQEFMSFFAKTIVERTISSSRQSVKEDVYMCHVYVRGDNLAGVVICDHDYPQRVAHTLITRILEEFSHIAPPSNWPTLREGQVSFNQLNVYLAKYQNPREADAITKIQEDLDETKIILHDTITAVLQRGEKLDDLVDKSAVLSMQSKAFYKTAKKTNSCCNFG